MRRVWLYVVTVAAVTWLAAVTVVVVLYANRQPVSGAVGRTAAEVVKQIEGRR
jgi:hypothetical protein